MEHAAVLKTLGCDALQGYAFARPMPAEELSAFAERSEWRKAS
jgi:EAL domain-containing protein (putative c-di-GMP-specific phosphodiesterase class I)